MVKRFGCMLLLLLAGFFAWRMPARTLAEIPTLSWTQPSQETLRRQINCTGTVTAEREAELYLGCAVIPKEVLCSVGDRVQQGEPLARLDLEMTQAVMSQSLPMAMDALPVGSSLVQSLKGQLSGQYAPLGKQIEQYLQTAAQQQERILYLPQEMTAPFDGIITGVSLQAQKLSQAGEAAFVLTDPTSYYILAQVPQSRAQEIRVGNEVTVLLSGAGGSLHGSVRKVHPTAKTSLLGGEPTVGVEVALDTGVEALQGGYTVSLQIETVTPWEALTLPYEAVDQDEEGEYVYCIDRDGHVEKCRITVGKQALGRLEITGGIAEDAIVVLNPQQVNPAAPRVRMKEVGGSE